jgi:hypothetical protein
MPSMTDLGLLMAVAIQRVGMNFYSHQPLEQLLRGFNAAYNARRQRVLEARTPDQAVAERLADKPILAKERPSGQAGLCDVIKARLVAESAEEVLTAGQGTHDLNLLWRGIMAKRRTGRRRRATAA